MGDWIESQWSQLPYGGCSSSIIGYDQHDRIWIIGGQENQCKNKLTSFNIKRWNKTNVFDTQYDDIPYNIYAYGQGYSQQRDNTDLYIIHPEPGNRFLIFDLLTHQFKDKFSSTEPKSINPDLSEIIFPSTVGSWACLTNIDEQLFISGGRKNGENTGKILDTIQIYDIPQHFWIISDNKNETEIYRKVKPMIYRRYRHSCLISNGHWLYQIGGFGGKQNDDRDTYLDSIEKIYVGDVDKIETRHWIEIDITLNKERMDLKSIYYQNLIYIVGGKNKNGIQLNQQVDIINITKEDDDDDYGIYSHATPDLIAYKVSGTALILVGETMFAFGGELTDKWQYSKMFK